MAFYFSNRKASPVKSGESLNEIDQSIQTFNNLVNDIFQVLSDCNIKVDDRFFDILKHAQKGSESDYKSRFMNLILLAFAYHLGITGKHIELFEKHLKSESVLSRNIRKEYGPIIFQEICKKNGLNLNIMCKEYGVVPIYGARGKPGRCAYNILLKEFINAFYQMSNDERNKVSEKINMFFRNYQQRKKETVLKHKEDIKLKYQKALKFEEQTGKDIVKIVDDADYWNEFKMNQVLPDDERKIIFKKSDIQFAFSDSELNESFINFCTRLIRG